MAHTVFYWDKSPLKGDISEKDRKMVLELLGSSSYEDISAVAVEGFESGIEWHTLKNRGTDVVVLVDTNEAGAIGVMFEAENEGLQVYEFFGFQLFKLDSRAVKLVGKELVKGTLATV